MRPLDLKSTLWAALFGAAILAVIGAAFGSSKDGPSGWYYPLAGAATGAGVQVGLRLFGVS
jgi:hypothetical protein